MPKIMLAVCLALITACAAPYFDKTNILPGQRVFGPGYSFVVPTQKSWFAVEFGTGHRIKLRQLNTLDSYVILAAVNRGPAEGMYQNAELHLQALRLHKLGEFKPAGFFRLEHEEAIDARYGSLCVRYTASGEDWRGRNNEGHAMVDSIGLTCAHPEMDNVLVSIEISRRYEVDALERDLTESAEALFASLQYHNGEN